MAPDFGERSQGLLPLPSLCWRRRLLEFLHVGEKIYCVTNALDLGHSDPGAIASVVIWCWAQVQSVNTVGIPNLACIRIFVDNDLCVWRHKWRLIEIKGAVQLSVGG